MAQEYTNYTVNMPRQAAWLVYINGVEVPVVGLTTSFGVWQIPTASIQLVPHVLLQRIGYEDRLQVVVFYLDEYYDMSNTEFRLLGEFEVKGWSYTNSAMGRVMTLNCEAHPRILKQLFMYYISAVDDVIVQGSPATATNANVVSESMVYYPASLFLHGIIRMQQKTETGTEPVASEEFIKSPFELISNLFIGLLGPIDTAQTDPNKAADGKLPKNAASAPGRNFFARWFQMTDFIRRWGGIPRFDSDDAKVDEGCFPLLKAARAAETTRAIQAHIGQSVGHSGSIWSLLQLVYDTLFMEIAMIPAPPLSRFKKGTMLLDEDNPPLKGKGPAEDDKHVRVLRQKGNDYSGLLQNFVKPKCIFGIPPKCNMIFPSMTQQYAFTEDYDDQPTRVYLGERELSRYISSQAGGSIQSLIAETMTTGYPPVVKYRMQHYVLDPKQNTKNFLVYPEELFKGPVTKQLNAPPWMFALSQMSEASGGGSSYDATILPTVGGKRGSEQYVCNVRSIIDPIIAKYAKQEGVPVPLVHATIYKESGYRMSIVDQLMGAVGLMQVQPAFYKDGKLRSGSMRSTWIGLKTGIPFEGMNPLDPDNNIRMGIRILKKVLHVKDNKTKETLWDARSASKQDLEPEDGKITDLEFAVWGYNAGIGRAKQLYAAYKKDPVGTYRTYQKYKKPVRTTLAAWGKYEALTAKINSKKIIADGEYGVGRAAKATPSTSDTHGATTGTSNNAGATKQGATTGTSKEAVNNTEAESTTVDGSTVVPSQALGRLFDLYARYEMYRLRYEHRTGGVSMVFNPYIVPGFPAVVFDELSSGLHTIGYVMNVTHTFSAQAGSPTMSTRVGMAFMRTFPEFIRAMRQGMEEHAEPGVKVSPDCGPLEPIRQVSEVFQTNGGANLFYKALFYPGLKKLTTTYNEIVNGKKKKVTLHNMIFDWKRMLEVKTFSGEQLDLTTLDLETAEDVIPQEWDYHQGCVAQPKNRFLEIFRAADSAMSWVARPVCTLREYVELRHDASIVKLQGDNIHLRGKDLSFYGTGRGGGKGTTQGGATFWGRIDTYAQGPGDLSTDAISRITNVDYSNTGVFPPLPGDAWDVITAGHGIPQTRANWDEVLRKYRKIVRGAVNAPQS